MTLRQSIPLRVIALLGLFAAVAWSGLENVHAQAGDASDSHRSTSSDPQRSSRGAQDTHGVSSDEWRAPNSAWLATQRRAAEPALRGETNVLLVVPVQGDKNGLDYVERSLISRLVSDRIARTTAYNVINPTAIAQYLGTNRSTFQHSDIAELATLTRAQRTLLLHAEHNRDGRWELRATLYGADPSAAPTTKSWDGLRYEDAHLPSDELADILASVVEFATDQDSRGLVATAEFDVRDFVFPETFDELISASRQSPLHAAAYLQLVAMLHPRGEFNGTRNSLFERSLVALQRVSPKSPYQRYFKARALAYLNRRPAAIAALGEPRNDHERALLEALNGNLPQLETLLAGMSADALGFMTFKDYQRIRHHYSPSDDEVPASFVEQNPNWAAFISRSLRDYDEWARYSDATIKLALEALMPAETVSLETELYGQLAVAAERRGIDAARLVWQHIDAFDERAVRNWRMEQHVSLSPLDILELAKATAVANHIRRVSVDLNKRGLPNSALEEIARFASLFSGHPEIKLIEGEALEAQADKTSGDEQHTLRAAAAEAYLTGFAWTGPMTWRAASVGRRYATLLRVAAGEIRPISARALSDADIDHFSRRYFEWPPAPGWLREFGYPQIRAGTLKTCLDYTWIHFRCIRFRIENETKNAEDPAALRAAILEEYAHRFSGHPNKAEFEVERARSSDDPNMELELLQRQVDAGSSDWSMYYALGRSYMRRGDYAHAKDVWMSYPGFDVRGEPISLADSNNAGSAGAMFYWIGQHEAAVPLLEMAAASGAGGAESMAAAARLALIDRDFESAAEWSAARARRYQSAYALRDLLQILHVIGGSEMAWRLFDQMQPSVQKPQVWTGALVGHRMAGKPLAAIAEWLSSSERRNKAVAKAADGRSSIDLAQRYLLIAGTMDRVPGPEFVDTVEAAPTHRHRPRYQGSSNSAGARVMYGGHEYTHDRYLPETLNEERLRWRQALSTRLEMLSAAMAAFLAGDYESAYQKFDDTAYFYYPDEFLPYHAFAAATVGKSEHILAVLERREEQLERVRLEEGVGNSELGYRFDEDLTYAVIAGLTGRHDEALERLNAALNNRPYMNDRAVFPMYQVVDLADRLYEKTGEAAYRDFALDLSRRHTVVLPMYGWAYFVVAKYSGSSIERRNAAASGLYLDPLSHRGSLLPEELLDEARELLESSGPRLLREAGRGTNTGV